MRLLLGGAIKPTSVHGQQSKDGEPYILHPIRVMLAGQTNQERVVGILHDVVEDTPVTLDNLRAQGFSEAVLAGVEAMTKRPEEDYMDFVARCKANTIARQVKLADLADNMNLNRLPKLKPKDLARLEKYHRARRYLLDLEESPEK